MSCLITPNIVSLDSSEFILILFIFKIIRFFFLFKIFNADLEKSVATIISKKF